MTLLRQLIDFQISGCALKINPLVAVWIVEGGKFDIAKLVCQAPEMVDAAEIYMEQGLSRVAQT